MSDPKRTELSVTEKRAILVGVILPNSAAADSADPLDELRGLVKTAGVNVVGTLMQRREYPDAKHYLGKGKLEELKVLAEETKAEMLIFDNNLSPSQGRNLEKSTDKLIVDRSEIILAIFSEHARTYESRLQVELAQLLYSRPRLKRMWTHLSRESGSGANKGAGEQQLEIDRRLIDVRLAELRERLKEVEKRRERMVAQRRDHLTVSLVGYTNAGKSTLMNALTGAGTYVADKLFATLDTRTRKWSIPHWGDVLLSDTVGFIRDLPHNLVASFKSTLEEARHADLLLHVVDASSDTAENQLQTVNQVLTEIGVDTSHTVLVFNKLDAVNDRSVLDVLRAQHPQAVSVSAATGQGLDRLARLVGDLLGDGHIEARISTDVGNGRLFAYLSQHAEITDTQYEENRVTFHCRVPKMFANGLRSPEVEVEILNDDSDSQREPTPPVLNGAASTNGHVTEAVATEDAHVE